MLFLFPRVKFAGARCYPVHKSEQNTRHPFQHSELGAHSSSQQGKHPYQRMKFPALTENKIPLVPSGHIPPPLPNHLTRNLSQHRPPFPQARPKRHSLTISQSQEKEDPSRTFLLLLLLHPSFPQIPETASPSHTSNDGHTEVKQVPPVTTDSLPNDESRTTF